MHHLLIDHTSTVVAFQGWQRKTVHAGLRVSLLALALTPTFKQDLKSLC